jgi:hypothetical protein
LEEAILLSFFLEKVKYQGRFGADLFHIVLSPGFRMMLRVLELIKLLVDFLDSSVEFFVKNSRLVYLWVDEMLGDLLFFFSSLVLGETLAGNLVFVLVAFIGGGRGLNLLLSYFLGSDETFGVL